MEISLKQSINKAATELLILPIPMAVKSQAKTYIDIFVDTTATGIGGLMLIVLINGLGVSIRSLSLVILLPHWRLGILCLTRSPGIYTLF
jgi:AAA family ATP:ADP antiporter